MTKEETTTLNEDEAKRLNRWVKEMLPSSQELEADKKYASIKNPNKGRGKTYIRDSIWENIELQEHELALLNTPLMQRLRRIKQLSSGYLFYPGATHTRFEHSLGVLEQTDRMCKWLMKNQPEHIDDFQHKNLRFAALCHDLGHGPFSHASEAFFKTLPPFDRKEKEEEKAAECEDRDCEKPEFQCEKKKTGSAEQLSAFIVSSEPFIDFCKKLSVDIDTEFVANAITGSLPQEHRHLGGIIKGPFDADKIDYLIRDGHYCGIPIKVDVEIIYRSLAVDGEGCKRKLVGKAKAAPPLIQLSRFRQYMFAAVYNHKVARIFDAMFARALKCAHDRGTAINGKLLKSAVDFLELDNEMLLTPGIVTEGTDAADLLNRLSNRNLFKVALELGNYPCCQKCKSFKRHGNCCDCDRCQEIREEEREKITKDCAKIADEAGIASHYVLFAKARAITYEEAEKMLLSKDGERIRLGDILDLHRESSSLQGFMEQDFLCCPVEHVGEVREIAREKLGKYEFEPPKGRQSK